jgi:hypothetical protein
MQNRYKSDERFLLDSLKYIINFEAPTCVHLEIKKVKMKNNIKFIHVLIIGVCFVSISCRNKNIEKPTKKIDKIIYQAYVGIDLELVDSLSIYSTSLSDSNYILTSSLNNKQLLDSSSLIRPGTNDKDRNLNSLIPLEFKNKYLFIFHLKNKKLAYFVSNLRADYSFCYIPNGGFYVPRLTSSIINGEETFGEIWFDSLNVFNADTMGIFKYTPDKNEFHSVWTK